MNHKQSTQRAGAIAAWSDAYSLCGFHKASHVLVGAGVGAVSLACLALVKSPGPSFCVYWDREIRGVADWRERRMDGWMDGWDG